MSPVTYRSLIYIRSLEICKVKTSEYDQEIPQPQTADKPVAPRGRATQQ